MSEAICLVKKKKIDQRARIRNALGELHAIMADYAALRERLNIDLRWRIAGSGIEGA
ncbi:MAG: hypothetical protein WCD56_15275 [Pseudolabrys sp.]